LSIQSIVLLTFVSVMLAIGQILFRFGARQAAPVEDVSSLMALMLSPTIVGAVAIYGATTVVYVIALQKVPLSLAYPFMALGYIILPLASLMLFGEPISLRYVLGVALILGGLFLAIS
jgi:undecaprenyl phosphate-alpha-L-ara4N flippase subunit ArnE